MDMKEMVDLAAAAMAATKVQFLKMEPMDLAAEAAAEPRVEVAAMADMGQ